MDIQGLHIELTNLCTLKCPGCSRTRFVEQWPRHWHNHNLSLESLQKFLDIDLSGLTINFCGNDGDCIYHPGFVEILTWFKAQNSMVQIHTNGSYKSQEWWQQVANVLDHRDQVVFAIDGTPENFTIYRKNADWNSIKTGISVVSESPATITWKHLVFSYNQDTIDQAQKTSESLGIDKFLVHRSDRYDKETDWLRPSSGFIGDRYEKQTEWKQDQRHALNISPRCKNHLEHFISAAGFYSPCCFLADFRFYYKTQWGKNKNTYDIRSTTFTEILARPTTVEFYDTLESAPSRECQYQCPGTD
jgi:hypothetical protein